MLDTGKVEKKLFWGKLTTILIYTTEHLKVQRTSSRRLIGFDRKSGQVSPCGLAPILLPAPVGDWGFML